MARLNTKPASIHTHEGAVAKHINAHQQLRRSVMSCMLWEDTFYEGGQTIAQRISDLVPQVSSDVVAAIAIEAREQMNLRHVPLLIAASMAKHYSGNSLVRKTVQRVIQRADELTEILAIVAEINGVDPSQLKSVLSSQMKRGIADAFPKFSEYQLAKYNRDGAIKLRDALFLTHPKPVDKEMEYMWKRLVDGNLKTPDTWETNLSAGEDKRETFTRLLQEGKLGYMALLRNLRNMHESGVDTRLIQDAILARKGAHRVLPFRYVAAARAVPYLEPQLDQALQASLDDMEQLPGKTIVLVDVSGSMDYGRIGNRSDLTYMDAAATLASVIPAESLRVFTFSDNVVEVPPRKGMGGVDTIIRSQDHWGTDLGGAVKTILSNHAHDRLIVITDEQSHTRVPDPIQKKSYMINVASYRNGVGYGPWIHIDGFSEAVLKYIGEMERAQLV